MSNEKHRTGSFKSNKTKNAISRVKAIATLLDLSTEDFLLDKLDQENSVKKCRKEINCGWQKISATCTYRSKLPNKAKNKKIVGSFSHVSSTINQYEQKNMKFLFSNSLKYMLSPDSYNYKPFNGVYRTMKFADSNVDTSYNKQIILKKPTILIPLNKSVTIPKDILLLANNKQKATGFSSILQNFHLNQNSCFSIPDISGLHITGDCPQTVAKNSLKGDWIPQSQSADRLIKERKQKSFQSIAEKTEKSIGSDSKKQQLNEQSKSMNSYSLKSKPDNTLSVVKLKVLTDQKKNVETPQHYISLSKSLSSLVPNTSPITLKDKSFDNNNNVKGQKTKKTNSNKLFFGGILKTFNQDQPQSDYTLRMKSNVTGTNQPFLSLGQNLLPLIMGKRMSECPTIHF